MKNSSKKKKEKLTKAVKSHTFAGNKYHIIWKKPYGCRGLCDNPDIGPEREIKIDPNQSDEELLKTAVDEGIHACIWPLDNDFVDDMSESLGSFLYRMGFRLSKED